MISIPYGISNYEKLINDGCYYVDRTNYLDFGQKNIRRPTVTIKQIVIF